MANATRMTSRPRCGVIKVKERAAQPYTSYPEPKSLHLCPAAAISACRVTRRYSVSLQGMMSWKLLLGLALSGLLSFSYVSRTCKALITLPSPPLISSSFWAQPLTSPLALPPTTLPHAANLCFCLTSRGSGGPAKGLLLPSCNSHCKMGFVHLKWTVVIPVMWSCFSVAQGHPSGYCLLARVASLHNKECRNLSFLGKLEFLIICGR